MTFNIRGTGRVKPGAHEQVDAAFRDFVRALEEAEVLDGTPFDGALTWSHWVGDDQQQQAVDEVTAAGVRDED